MACEQCGFWEPDKNDLAGDGMWGFCHGAIPMAVPRTGSSQQTMFIIWPKVARGDRGCPNWKPRKAPAPDRQPEWVKDVVESIQAAREKSENEPLEKGE